MNIITLKPEDVRPLRARVAVGLTETNLGGRFDVVGGGKFGNFDLLLGAAGLPADGEPHLSVQPQTQWQQLTSDLATPSQPFKDVAAILSSINGAIATTEVILRLLGVFGAPPNQFAELSRQIDNMATALTWQMNGLYSLRTRQGSGARRPRPQSRHGRPPSALAPARKGLFPLSRWPPLLIPPDQKNPSARRILARAPPWKLLVSVGLGSRIPWAELLKRVYEAQKPA